MNDNPEGTDRRNNVKLLSDHFKQFLGNTVRRKKRSLVQCVDCNCDHNSNTPPSAAQRVDREAEVSPVAVNDTDPVAKMANEDDQVGRIPPAPANKEDPVVEAPPAEANEGDPDAVMADGDNPDEILVVPARLDPDTEMQAAAEQEMPEEMREHIIGRMGGYRVQMIIEKVLTETDMRRDQGRLLLPMKKVKVEFVTVEEKKYLEHRSKKDNEVHYMDTVIVGSNLSENPMQFKRWLVGTRYLNCFMNQWNCFSETYGLKVRDTVRMWSFRVDQRDEETNVVKSELRFALIKI